MRRSAFLCVWRKRLDNPSVFLLLLALTALVSLTGCGQLTRSGTSGATTATTAALPSATAPPHASDIKGCPGGQAPGDAATFVPDVTVSQEASPAQPVALTHGQRLEIRLAPGAQWRLANAGFGSILTATSAEGWYNPAVNACIWRFTAASAGSVRLTFDGLVLCQPANLHCVATTDSATFTVDVR